MRALASFGQGRSRKEGDAINDFGQTLPGEPLLEVRGVVVRFGGLTALDHVSFEVAAGEIRGLIGPNGSGKTTLFNCISNIYRCQEGEIRLRGARISGMARHRMPALGLGRTFQNVALFATMTVRDNVLVGAHHLAQGGFLGGCLGLGSASRSERAALVQLGHVLAVMGLEAEAEVPVSHLPFATQKRVELARALIGGPSLLLLDEPAGGLNHEEVAALAALIRRIRDEFRLAVLLVEHHMNLVMNVSDRVVALEFGRKIADGLPSQVQNEPEVIRAYLGTTEAAAAA